jgi:hypothetical protein
MQWLCALQTEEAEMAFKFFSFGFSEPRYIRRTRAYLQEARMAVLEHSIAAEYYQSSAQMYAERAARLEEELRLWEAGDLHHVPEVPHRYSATSHITAAKPVIMDAPQVSPAVGVVRAA